MRNYIPTAMGRRTKSLRVCVPLSSSSNGEEAAGISRRLSCTLPPYYCRLLPTYFLLAVLQATKSWVGAWEWGFFSFMLRLIDRCEMAACVQLVYTLAADQAILGMPQRVDWKGGPYSTCCVGPNQQLKNKLLLLKLGRAACQSVWHTITMKGSDTTQASWWLSESTTTCTAYRKSLGTSFFLHFGFCLCLSLWKNHIKTTVRYVDTKTLRDTPRRMNACCSIWGILQLIGWILPLATHCYTHYHLHSFHFKFKDLVAKQHPKKALWFR